MSVTQYEPEERLGKAYDRRLMARLLRYLRPSAGLVVAATLILILASLAALAGRLKQVTLRAILFGAPEGQELEARLGGAVLRRLTRDPKWKDPQILSPRPQRASGGSGQYRVNPAQELLRLDFAVAPELCRIGENRVELRLMEPAEPGGKVVLEKLELHVEYARR